MQNYSFSPTIQRFANNFNDMLPQKSWILEKNALNLQFKFAIIAMPLKSDKSKPLKLYYSIKEVAAKFNVNESLLRYWESEFPHLKPQTSGNRVRQYTQKDIDKISIIYNLVKVRGFKISAARKLLNENRAGVETTAKVLNTLISIRDELTEMKRQLDQLE